MDYNQTHLNKFTNEVKKIKQLSSDEQYNLFQQYKLKPTEELRTRLIKNNLRLVLKIVLSKPEGVNSIEDKISVASLALVRAIDDYNPDLGYTFATFARRYIDNELFNDYNNHGSTIKEKYYVKQKVKNGEWDKISTISGSTKIGDEDGTSIEESLISDTFDNLFDLDNNQDHQLKLDEFWKDIKSVLKPNQYDVIKAFYSDNVVVQGVKSRRMTDTAIANVMGTTKQNVGQIRMYALARIQRSGILSKYRDNIDFFRF